MAKSGEKYCALCGRREQLVRSLKPRDQGYICDDCDNLQMKGATETSLMRNRDASINDVYQRYKVEVETQGQLRKQFQTTVAAPHDPEKPRVSQGNENANGFQAHPLLKDKVQFNGANENMKLPNMDPEQWENYLEYQLQMQNEKRLEMTNQQTMRPTGPTK